MAEKKKARAVEPGDKWQETWKMIEDAMYEDHGCLLPPGEAKVSLVLPWTKEKYLGELKRKGKIISWGLDKEYVEGNLRRYVITLDTEKI